MIKQKLFNFKNNENVESLIIYADGDSMVNISLWKREDEYCDLEHESHIIEFNDQELAFIFVNNFTQESADFYIKSFQ